MLWALESLAPLDSVDPDEVWLMHESPWVFKIFLTTWQHSKWLFFNVEYINNSSSPSIKSRPDNPSRQWDSCPLWSESYSWYCWIRARSSMSAGNERIAVLRLLRDYSNCLSLWIRNLCSLVVVGSVLILSNNRLILIASESTFSSCLFRKDCSISSSVSSIQSTSSNCSETHRRRKRGAWGL